MVGRTSINFYEVLLTIKHPIITIEMMLTVKLYTKLIFIMNVQLLDVVGKRMNIILVSSRHRAFEVIRKQLGNFPFN